MALLDVVRTTLRAQLEAVYATMDQPEYPGDVADAITTEVLATLMDEDFIREVYFHIPEENISIYEVRSVLDALTSVLRGENQ